MSNGLKKEKVKQILVTYEKLSRTNTSQEAALGSTGVITQERIQTLNEVWDICFNQICRAGKIIFEENPAKYKRYLVYTTGKAKVAEPEEDALAE